jgi:hypothetical protein
MAFEDDFYRINRMRDFRDFEDAPYGTFAPEPEDLNFAANLAKTVNTAPQGADQAQGLFSTYATTFNPDQAAIDFWSNKINTLGYDAALNEFLNPSQGASAPRFTAMSQDPDYLAATGQTTKVDTKADTTGALPGADTTKVADTLTVADTATTGALPGADATKAADTTKVTDTVTAVDTSTTGALPGADTVTAAAQDLITGTTTGAETKADTSGALATAADMSQQGALPGATTTTTAKTTDPKDLVYDYQGKSYDKNQLLSLAAQIGPNITSLAGGVFSTSGQSVGFNFDEATKILGAEPTVGQQVVLDMARNLLNMGVTDLSQLNIKEQKEDLEVFEIFDDEGRPTGTYAAAVQDPNNPDQTTTRILTPEEAARIRSQSTMTSEGEEVRKIAEDILTGRTLYSDDQLINASNQVKEGLSFDIGVTYTGPDSTRYKLIMNPVTGKPEFAAYYSSTSDMDKVGAILTMASFVPQLAVFAKAIQAGIAIRSGDVIAGLANLAGIGGFDNVSTALKVADAAQKGDAVQLVSAVLSNTDIAKAAGDIKLVGDTTLKDVGNGIKLADAITNQNWSAALTIAGTMANSPDLVTAGAATKVITAVQSGNPILIADAAMNLNRVTNAANKVTDANVASNIANTVQNTQVASLNSSITGTATDAIGDALDTTVGGGKSDVTVSADDVNAEDTFSGVDQLAVDTFIDAKNKGATDEEALAAANNVYTTATTSAGEFSGFEDATKGTTDRGVLKIGNTEADTLEEATALATSKGYTSFTFNGTTYALSASAQDIERQVTNQQIASQDNFADAYKLARESLGPGKTFEWNGKTYSTDTREENPTLAAASDAARATQTAGDKKYEGYDSKAMGDAQSQIDLSSLDQAQTYGTFDPFLKSAGLGGEYIIVDDKISKQLIDPVVKTVGLATRGVGGIVDFTAGTLQAINVIDKNSPLIQIASDLKELGNQQVGEYLVNEEKKFISRISEAEGLTGKLKALADGIIENPSALLTLGASELVEEAPSVVGAVVSIIARAPKIIAYGINAVTNLVEAAGANYNDTKKQALDAGMSEADAHAAAQKSAGAAGALAFVLGPVAEMPLIKRAGDIVEGVAQTGVKQGVKEVGKTVGKEVVTESAEGGGAAAVGSYFATGSVDMNQVLTSAVLDPAVAGNVSGTVATVVEVAGNKPATSEMISASVSNPDQAQTLVNTINTTMQPGADLKQASVEIVAAMTESGMNTQQAESVANTAVAEQILTNINNYGDLNIPNVNITVGADKFGNAVTLGDYLGSSVTGLGNIEYIAPDVSIGTNAQGQPITVGDLSSLGKFGTATDTTAVDTTKVGDTTTDTKTGATTTTSTDATTGATTQTTTNPTTNTTTETTINSNTGINTQVATDTNTNTTTTTTTDTNANTTTQVTTNANTNTTTETTVNTDTNTVTQTNTNANTNTQTTTQINNDTNVVTETKTDNNSKTETTIVTDPNNDTQITTVINTDTGEVIDTKTTVVPPDWKEPDIDTPDPVTETTDTKTKTPPTKKTPTRSQQSLMPGLGLLAAPAVYPDDGPKFKDPFISSKEGQRKFVGSLDPFFQEVESGDMLHPEFMAETPQLQDQEETKEETMPNYFTYGMQTDLDKLFSPFGASGTGLSQFEEGDEMAAKRGGLATPLMAGGGLTRYGRYAGGGVPLVAHSGKTRVDFRQGDAVTGPGDGQSDDIPAMLADGEFVIPADVVAALGNGSTKAGSDKLYDMMHSIRAYHRAAKPKDLPPEAKASPLDYLKKPSRKARR